MNRGLTAPAMGQPRITTDSGLTPQDLAVLTPVERVLSEGLQLSRWLQQKDADRSWNEQFPLGQTALNPDGGFGFFDQLQLGAATLPVMGNVQEMAFDQVKGRPGSEVDREWIQSQLREFVLRYFMRVSSFRLPQPLLPRPVAPGGRLLKILSWCPDDPGAKGGFGFEQVYYKTRNGVVGKFSDESRSAIVDLRELGTKYEWIVVKVRIFNFSLIFKPLGYDFPQLTVPLQEQSYLVLSRDFIVDQSEGNHDLPGTYGLGYAFLKNVDNQTPFAYGPGEFDNAVQLIHFVITRAAEIKVRMLFAANRPTRIVNVSINPLKWTLTLANLTTLGLASFLLPSEAIAPQLQAGEIDPVFAFISLANLVTGGFAARQFCVSRKQLEQDFLAQHYLEHYNTITGTIQSWRRVPDWFAPPHWAMTGEAD